MHSYDKNKLRLYGYEPKIQLTYVWRPDYVSAFNGNL